jgi:hypothetical protein
MLLHRWTRRAALTLGVLMHVGMWATLDLGTFSFVMLASYIAFIPPERIERWLPGVSPRGALIPTTSV